MRTSATKMQEREKAQRVGVSAATRERARERESERERERERESDVSHSKSTSSRTSERARERERVRERTIQRNRAISSLRPRCTRSPFRPLLMRGGGVTLWAGGGPARSARQLKKEKADANKTVIKVCGRMLTYADVC
jgi:hypothetical protein